MTSESMRDPLRAMMRACERACRPQVVELLKSFGVTKLNELKLRDVDAFVEQCNALQAKPEAVTMHPEFNIGAHVRPKGRSGFKGTVVGYELRYRMKSDHNEVATTHAWHPDKLERVPEPVAAPQPAKSWPKPEPQINLGPLPAKPWPLPPWPTPYPGITLEPFYELCSRYARTFGNDSLVMHLHQLAGCRTASQVKAQDIINVSSRLTHVLSLPSEDAPPKWVW